MPVLYVVLGGFRSTGQITNRPTALPDPWIFTNYTSVLTSGSFWSQVVNSTIAALVTTGGVVLLGVMAAFVLARYEFRGRDALNTLFTVGLLFPVTVAILPLYLLLQDLGLLNSLLGVIIPQVAFALPMTILILVPFLRAIPVELEDAAAIDGTSRIGFFWRIVLPLSGPGSGHRRSAGLRGELERVSAPAARPQRSRHRSPCRSGVQDFSTQYSQDTAMVLAFTSLAMLPALLFFTLAQRRIVGGLTGAVKG